MIRENVLHALHIFKLSIRSQKSKHSIISRNSERAYWQMSSRTGRNSLCKMKSHSRGKFRYVITCFSFFKTMRCHICRCCIYILPFCCHGKILLLHTLLQKCKNETCCLCVYFADLRQVLRFVNGCVMEIFPIYSANCFFTSRIELHFSVTL